VFPKASFKLHQIKINSSRILFIRLSIRTGSDCSTTATNKGRLLPETHTYKLAVLLRYLFFIKYFLSRNQTSRILEPRKRGFQRCSLHKSLNEQMIRTLGGDIFRASQRNPISFTTYPENQLIFGQRRSARTYWPYFSVGIIEHSMSTKQLLILEIT